jgi:hypothetical protein
MFKTVSKDGTLTAYGLACGYVESEWFNVNLPSTEGIKVTLWHELGCYHVRAHDFDASKRIFWDSFRSLPEARKRYRQAISELKRKD